MTIPKPKKEELKEAFISRCMGNHIMLTDFPDDSDRGVVCNTAWKETNRVNRLTTLNFHANFHIIRREIVDGVDYIVAPVVAIVEGVHHGSTGREFYPGSEISKTADEWNGMPITIDHPEKGGGRVSASDPEIAKYYLVGKLDNMICEGNKLKGEIWVEVDKIKRLSPEALARIETGKPLEVSTGLYADGDGQSGNWNGEEFDNTLSGFRPDHLALLPNAVGACSIADGCGVRMNTKKECGNCKLNLDRKEATIPLKDLNLVKKEKEVVINLPEGGVVDFKKLKELGLLNMKKGGEKNVEFVKLMVDGEEKEIAVDAIVGNLKTAGFKVLELSHGKMREQIYRALTEMEKPGTMRFLREVFDKFFIFELIHEGEAPKLFSQDYSFNTEDEIKFKGDPTEVREKVEFIELSDNSDIKKKEVSMNRSEQIKALIANKLVVFTDEDTEMLEGIGEERFNEFVTLGEKLAKCECDEDGNIIGNKKVEEKDDSKELKTLQEKTKAAEEKVVTLQGEKEEAEKEVKTLKAEKEEADKKPASFEDVLATADEATKEVIQNGIKANREKKDGLIKTLIDNKKNPFSKEDLEKKPMDELENLVSFGGGAPVDYSGQGTVVKRTNVKDVHERQEDGKGGRGVPKVKEMKWNKDGTPDLSHLKE